MLDKLVGNNKGQLLIEAMVAMGIVSVGLLGAFSLLSNSLAISKVTSNQYVGTYLAAEGIEVAKNMLDTNIVTDSGAWNSPPWNEDGHQFTLQYNSLTPGSCPPGSCPINMTTTLLFDPATGLYNYETGIPTTFTRVITIHDLPSGDEIQVDSKVSWTDPGGTTDSVNLEDDFYDWAQT
jgi:type II secretory pathway pseudopilin PulG